MVWVDKPVEKLWVTTLLLVSERGLIPTKCTPNVLMVTIRWLL